MELENVKYMLDVATPQYLRWMVRCIVVRVDKIEKGKVKIWAPYPTGDRLVDAKELERL